jgi:hypothetical protein
MRVAAGDRNREGVAHGHVLNRTMGAPRARPVAANDNPPRHAPWRRFVAASIAALLLLTLVVLGAVCTTGTGGTQSSSASAAFPDKNLKVEE